MEVIGSDYPCVPKQEKINLLEILSLLAKKNLQVKLLVGIEDAINGYGWHVCYYVQIFKTVEYCSKCRNNYNLDYKEFNNSSHRHSHRSEIVKIFSKEFIDEKELCNALMYFT
jgi:hypothetical protein